jgi:RNA polymerase sigma factor (sigma-70 family)
MHANTEHSGRSQVKGLAEQLYRERRRYLLGIAHHNGAGAEDAEEAVQEAFAAFIRAFDPGRGAPALAWLTLTLKRECWARSRRRQRPSAELEAMPDDLPGPAQSIERTENLLEARHHLARLKPAERRALGLIAAGYSYREVGEITGWTHTKINRCASEGRAALRKIKSTS